MTSISGALAPGGCLFLLTWIGPDPKGPWQLGLHGLSARRVPCALARPDSLRAPNGTIMIKALSFSDTTIGKKVLMAVSGLVLFGFVIGHMLGNLQVFLGPDALNAYGVALRGQPLLLWGVRVVLLAAFLLHVTMAMQLSVLSSAARPVGYKKRKDAITTFAARSMLYSGILVLLFVLYHLAHFTFPGVAMGAYEHSHTGDVYANFVNGFSIPWVVALYVAAQIALGLHIYHGAWSLLQTFGLNNPLRNASWHGGARTLALVVVVGNVILPLSVLLGLVQ